MSVVKEARWPGGPFCAALGFARDCVRSCFENLGRRFWTCMGTSKAGLHRAARPAGGWPQLHCRSGTDHTMAITLFRLQIFGRLCGIWNHPTAQSAQLHWSPWFYFLAERRIWNFHYAQNRSSHPSIPLARVACRSFQQHVCHVLRESFYRLTIGALSPAWPREASAGTLGNLADAPAMFECFDTTGVSVASLRGFVPRGCCQLGLRNHQSPTDVTPQCP